MLLLLLLAAAQDHGGLIVDQNRIDRATPAPRSTEKPPVTRAKTEVAAPKTIVPITGIQFDGAQAPAPVARAAQRFLGKPSDTPTLQRLAAALSTAYAKSNVALYTVAIPSQDFTDGVVTVSLTEGRIASLDVKDAKHRRRLAGDLAPLAHETPLSRRTMERQISIARALPGLNFDVAMADPQANGALTMTVAPKQKHHKFSLGFDNRGVDLLGDGAFDAKAQFYSTAFDGDDLTLEASASPDFKRYRYFTGSYAAPIGHDGLMVGANAGYLETKPEGYDINGRAKLAGVTLAYPLIQDFHRAVNLSLGLDGIDSDNATFGNLIATERTRAVRAAASWSDTREKRSVSFSGSLSRGLGILGARVTAPQAETDFTKGVVAASYNQAIGKRVAVRLSGSAQYSRNRLPAAERFAIGGEDIGRAFDTALLTGDRGAGGLAELAYRPIRAKDFASSEVYVFGDGGFVTVLARGPGTMQADYSLASAGVGVRARWKEKIELGLEGSRSIDSPYAGYKEDWRLGVEWKLDL
jgi:hemolysin activation/secretion protein